LDEDYLTEKYMIKYGGPEYVRGGIYCSVTLPDE